MKRIIQSLFNSILLGFFISFFGTFLAVATHFLIFNYASEPFEAFFGLEVGEFDFGKYILYFLGMFAFLTIVFIASDFIRSDRK